MRKEGRKEGWVMVTDGKGRMGETLSGKYIYGMQVISINTI